MLQGLNEVFVGEEFGDYNEKSYGDIRTYEEFYLWAQGPFTEGLLPAEYYDGSVRTPAPTPTFSEGLLPAEVYDGSVRTLTLTLTLALALALAGHPRRREARHVLQPRRRRAAPAPDAHHTQRELPHRL